MRGARRARGFCSYFVPPAVTLTVRGRRGAAQAFCREVEMGTDNSVRRTPTHPADASRYKPCAATLAALSAAALVGAVIPAVAALAFLISLLARRPLIAVAARRWPWLAGRPAAQLSRRALSGLTAAWGIGLLAAAGRRCHPGRHHTCLAAPRPSSRPAGPEHNSDPCSAATSTGLTTSKTRGGTVMICLATRVRPCASRAAVAR